MLWERQQKDKTIKAVIKRQQSAVYLRRVATPSNLLTMSPELYLAQDKFFPFMDDATLNTLNHEVYSACNPYHHAGW
jgi:hypothetical protein